MKKSNAGRPTKYNAKKHPPAALRLAMLGLTNDEMAESMAISPSTFSLWIVEHEEFSVALYDGRDGADSRIAKSLYQKALGYSCEETRVFCSEGQIVKETIKKNHPPDTGAASLWLKNRQSKRWRDKQEVEISADTGLSELLKERRKRADELEEF